MSPCHILDSATVRQWQQRDHLWGERSLICLPVRSSDIWYGVHWQVEKCGQNVDNREFVRSLHIWGSESILFIWLGSDPSEICHTSQLHIEIETTQVLSALLDQYSFNICWRKLIKATEKPTHYTFTSSYRNNCFRNIKDQDNLPACFITVQIFFSHTTLLLIQLLSITLRISMNHTSFHHHH